MRHLIGIVLVVVLTAILYWVWADGVNLVLRMVRRMPALRAILSEFSPMLFFLFVCILLGLAQVVWDRLTTEADPE